MSSPDSIGDLHWVLGIIQNLDVGLVVVDRSYSIRLWNGFMENHSALAPNDVIGKPLSSVIGDVSPQWLQSKIDSVFLLKNSAYSTWQQRPYITKFRSYRPITGRSETMYQNVTFMPLDSLTGEVGHVCIIIYDVTETAEDELALQQLGMTDSLTQLLNRRAWNEQLRSEHYRVVRSGGASALLLLEIDHFSHINRTHGHQAGDEVIRTVAEQINITKRTSDIAGRHSDREFAIILSDTDAEGAHDFAERLRTLLAETTITYSHQDIHITLSIGMAENPPLGADHLVWHQHADEARIQASSSGGNRMVCYQALADLSSPHSSPQGWVDGVPHIK